MTELQEKLCGIVTKNLHVDRDDLTADIAFEDLHLDSLALIEFTVVLEREFNVQVDDEEVTPDFTIAATADLLAGKGVVS